MSDIVDRITAVLREHRRIGTWGNCWKCGRTGQSYEAHVAERVAAELPDELTLWFCSFCRDWSQIGVKPDKCGQCGDDESLDDYPVPWVRTVTPKPQDDDQPSEGEVLESLVVKWPKP